jgi:putative PIG3 family NAD(P)H quinone oxidoreductase
VPDPTASPAAIPETMPCIQITTPGGPEVLQPATRPVPQPADGEVLVRVAAAGVNRPDIVQRQGAYPPPPGASDLPGLEIAGEIVATAGDCQGLQPGDTVCALVAGGGYAEYCTAPAKQCLPVPDGYSMIQAAALPETYFTVWTNVFQRGRLQPGEILLVHGGASGIGTTAVQLAAALGSRVFATVGTADKAAAVEKLGAEKAINYRDEDFVAIVQEATDHNGADVILDMVGGDYVARNIAVAAVEGRIVNIAFLHGPKVELNMLPIMLKRLTLTGSTLRPRTVDQKAVITEELRERVWPLLNADRIGPVIDKVFPLKEAAAAHAHLEMGGHVGKVVLEVG